MSGEEAGVIDLSLADYEVGSIVVYEKPVDSERRSDANTRRARSLCKVYKKTGKVGDVVGFTDDAIQIQSGLSDEGVHGDWLYVEPGSKGHTRPNVEMVVGGHKRLDKMEVALNELSGNESNKVGPEARRLLEKVETTRGLFKTFIDFNFSPNAVDRETGLNNPKTTVELNRNSKRLANERRALQRREKTLSKNADLANDILSALGRKQMRTIILPGYSVSNRPWVYELSDDIEKKLSVKVHVHEWVHWVSGNFSLKKETDRIIKFVDKQVVNIIAKSVGTRVAMRILKDNPALVNKLILCGIPTKGQSESAIKTYSEGLANIDPANVIVFQNDHDPLASHADIKKFIGSINQGINVVKKERNDHSYPFSDDFIKYFSK